MKKKEIMKQVFQQLVNSDSESESIFSLKTTRKFCFKFTYWLKLNWLHYLLVVSSLCVVL